MSACISFKGEFDTHEYPVNPVEVLDRFICINCGVYDPAAISSALMHTCECHDAVTSIRKDLDNLLEVVSAIHKDLAPTMEALQNSPMLKMLFPKKKD